MKPLQWRRRLGLFVAFALLVTGCANRAVVKEGGGVTAVGERVLFLSTVQGNPLCLVLDVRRMLVSRLFRGPRTKGVANAWIVFPGGRKNLLSEKEKTKRNPEAPLNLMDDSLLFQSDQDEFVFYHRYGSDELLLVTKPVFADRTRESPAEEIAFGRMPAELWWKSRKIPGEIYYERRTAEQGEDILALPLTGLQPGETVYALWAPDGEFLLIETSEAGSPGARKSLAVLQDHRGRWRETYDAHWHESACAFQTTGCDAESDPFILRLAGLDVEGTLTPLDAVQVPWSRRNRSLRRCSTRCGRPGLSGPRSGRSREPGSPPPCPSAS